MLSRTLVPAAFLFLTACGSGTDQPAATEVPETDALTLTQQAQPLSDDTPVKEKTVVTKSGLQYEVMKSAEGPKPTADSYVTVHYVGTLVDGTEFDSSYSRGQPASFLLSGTIEGWIEGVQLMSVGARYRFVIPAELAYGDRGAGTLIGPGATLVFEVELLEINT